MAINLIQQQEMLKGLPDDDLQSKASNPVGDVPPFLVLTELSRRKSTRDAYAAQQARRKPSTTVAEDLLSAPLGSPAREAMGRGAPQGGGGIGIAAALPDGAPEVPAYAEGGLVSPSILERISSRRISALDDVDNDRDNLFNRSLMSAGAAMMSNGSANFMKNVGAGFTGGIKAWDDGTQVIDSRESAAMQDLLGVHSAEETSRLAALDEQFRRDQEARLTSQFNQELEAPTADIKNAEYFKGLDLEDKGDYMRVNGGSGASSDLGQRARAMTEYNDTRTAVAKEVNAVYESDLAYATPEEKAALQQKIEAEITSKTNDRFARVYPDYVTLMPELLTPTGGAPTTSAPTPSGAADWTTYFSGD